jgi:hypothetical protein
MYDRNRLLGERPSHGVIAGLIFSALIAYAGVFAYNVSHIHQDLSVIGRQIGGVVIATKLMPRTDVKDAAFDARFAALEGKK